MESNNTAVFLGTGTSQGVPVIACECPVCQSGDSRDSRLRTSLMFTIDQKNFVIDTGPDFRQQMLKAQVKSLEAVLYTHEHKDHVAGLDDVRAFNFKQKKDMRLYGNSNVEEALKREFHYAFAVNKYPGVPQLDFNLIDKGEFELDGIKIQPIEVMHHRLPVLGFRIHDFVYITDANFISDEEKVKMKGCHTLVINALRLESHLSHFNLEQALDLIQEIKPRQAYLVHISHLFGTHEEIEKMLPEGVNCAYDGLKISI